MEDEKFISIEYKRWEEFYKPLEESYKKLEEDLEAVKKNRRIDIHMHFGSRLLRGFDDVQVGFVEFSIEGPLMIDIPARDNLSSMLVDDITSKIREKRRIPGCEFSGSLPREKETILISKEQVERAIVDIECENIKLEEKRRETSNEIQSLITLKKNIPWIVRKLFKIR